MSISDYMRVKDAAAAIGKNPMAFAHAAERGEIPTVKAGRARLVPRAWVDAYLAARAGTISQADAARRLDVTRQRVNQLVKSGRLCVTAEGRVQIDSLAAYQEAQIHDR